MSLRTPLAVAAAVVRMLCVRGECQRNGDKRGASVCGRRAGVLLPAELRAAQPDTEADEDRAVEKLELTRQAMKLTLEVTTNVTWAK